VSDRACEVCQVRAGRFLQERICGQCRLHIASTILSDSAAEVGKLWRVTTAFDDCRQKAFQIEKERTDPPRPAVLASVAWGLLEQGFIDDPVVLAGLAISAGEEADVNRVGASALEVLLDPRLAQPGQLESLRRGQGAT
jgi:hypothetical protein